MRALPAHLAVTTLLLIVAVAPALGSPSIIDVRIEGRSQTLFEGPIRTEGHAIRASSDTQERACDGTNGGAHATPGPTPTTAAVDAMSMIGETFDGKWASGTNDYFITRWGPDAQSAEAGEFWGVLVNAAFLSTGGCQYELTEGDQVLWVYNAFAHNPFLTLRAAGASPAAAVPTAMAPLGGPFTVEVESYSASEGTHHPLGPYNGAEVSPVSTAVNGFQSVETGSPSSASTGSDGKATLTFTTPGWHRLKAAAANAFRSNRLDVCVPPDGASGCGPLPADDQTRPLIPGSEPVTSYQTGSPAGAGGPGAPSSGTLGVQRAAPRTLRLDGLVLNPIDDRSSSLIYRGRWRRQHERGAWDGTVTVGHAGASMIFRLGAGRPVVVLRHVRGRARVELLEGRHHQIFTISTGAPLVSKLVIAARRAQRGRVTLRILGGTIGIDAVALTA